MNGVLWGWVALALVLVAAWLFDRRARRHHRVRADIGKVNDERYSHAGSMDPDLGAPPHLYARAEEVARRDRDPDRP
jgi:hypothetical protein